MGWRQERSGGGAGESSGVWGRAGEKEGGPGMAENGSGGRHWPPAGGVAALQWRAAGRARRRLKCLTGGFGQPWGPVGTDGVQG
jgi:hypothetical protein